MGIFDFIRQRGGRKPQDPGRPRSIFGRILDRFRRPSPAPEPEEPVRPPAQIQETPDDTNIDYYDIDAGEMPEDTGLYVHDLDTEPVGIPEGVTDVSNQYLLDTYGGMLQTMVDRGYIDAFGSDADAAEFLRVLSSQAWEEAHGYWYSPAALGEIQDAILRGATAGTLQSNYNEQIEKKSNHYLETWEDWLNPPSR